uniref:Centrosomal protein 112 n=1 Tax=Salarias fasciatus TaxID=181472 RepID=A0A672H841_SALFA
MFDIILRGGGGGGNVVLIVIYRIPLTERLFISVQTISGLESQLSRLREDLQQARAHHKQQLADMAALQEEEKQRAALEKEASLERLCADMERIHSNLERSHQQEKNAIHEKTNSRLKQIEKEYSQKLAKSAQLIAELQTAACDSKEEVVRLKQAMEKHLEDATVRWEEERRTLTQHADRTNKVSLTGVHQEYQERIKGLMPAEVRQDLEDTIASLKAQVNFLQKRASLLQEDLDAFRSRR